MYAIDLYTGNERWTRTTGDSIYCSPAISNGYVYFGSYDRKFYALDAATGAIRWTFSDGNLISGAPTVLNDIVYFSTFGDTTYAAEARTGKIVWQFGDGRYSPVTTWGDTLILTGANTLYGMRMSR
jgi:outer membrane protein assembly factor BamB